MHQMTLFQDKKFKILLGRGLSPLPRPHPSGQGTPPPHTPLSSAPTAPRLRLKDDLCFRLLLGTGYHHHRPVGVPGTVVIE